MAEEDRPSKNGRVEITLCSAVGRALNQLGRTMRRISIGFALMLSLLITGAQLRQLPDGLADRIETLRQVHVFFRHGERMPTSLYPTDPNQVSDFKDGLGRISIRGKRDQYALGQQLRGRYQGFLSADTNEVKARSSGRDRCLESMEVTLAALYEPDEKRTFENSLRWQPVPVQTMPVDIDGMLYEDSICRKDDEAIERLRTTGEGKRVLTEFKDLMSKLQEKSGKKMKDWVSVRDLLDTLTIESSLGLEIPDWADSETLKEMEACAKYTTLLNYEPDERIRFRAGLLLKDISLHFDDVVNNARKHKLYMYASHDVLVAAYLSAFDSFNGLAVPSSTTVITELYEDSPGKFRVQMLLRNDTETAELKPVHVPGCKIHGCTLDEWNRKVSRFIPMDWRSECGEDALPIKLYDRF
ncbi:lysosomal acid phosphatase [Galendromus occidentalis]|uniref:Lysosomal acid phosphatase n=1 Tax=Galendromus occidentalis TaxID=34638 RepID=A0AAJ6QS38_9ACAR|nr:lysosomal acid phosphatase [Galendromus occidentalis]